MAGRLHRSAMSTCGVLFLDEPRPRAPRVSESVPGHDVAARVVGVDAFAAATNWLSSRPVVESNEVDEIVSALARHEVKEVARVYTYSGHIDGRGEVLFRVKDLGRTPRWECSGV